MKTKLAEDAEEDFAVSDHRFELFAHLHHRGLDRTFIGEPALSVFHAHMEHTSLTPKLFVFGIEQRILLEPPAVARERAGCEHRLARLADRVESQLDLALENRRAHEGRLLIANVSDDSDHGDYY